MLFVVGCFGDLLQPQTELRHNTMGFVGIVVLFVFLDLAQYFVIIILCCLHVACFVDLLQLQPQTENLRPDGFDGVVDLVVIFLDLAEVNINNVDV
jgi:hypothetical protein